jgi:hypothetical protein
LVLLLSTPGAAHAAGASITNGGSRIFSICHNAASESACASGIGVLQSGQNSKSKYGWEDTDMIAIPANCQLQKWTVAPPYYDTDWRPWAAGGTNGRWFKINDLQGGKYRVVC